MCNFVQRIKEEVSVPKTTKRVRESPALEPDEPEKITPKRPKTQVRASIKGDFFWGGGVTTITCELFVFCKEKMLFLLLTISPVDC